MFFVYVALILWLMVYFKVYQLHFMYYMFGRECGTSTTRLKFNATTTANKDCMNFKYYCMYNLNIEIFGYIRFFLLHAADWFPQPANLNICNKFVRKLCIDYVFKTRDFFLLSVIAVVAVIVGLGCLLLSLASMMIGRNVHEEEHQRELEQMDRYRSPGSFLFGLCMCCNCP